MWISVKGFILLIVYILSIFRVISLRREPRAGRPCHLTTTWLLNLLLKIFAPAFR
jgi:hypothetical protein